MTLIAWSTSRASIAVLCSIVFPLVPLFLPRLGLEKIKSLFASSIAAPGPSAAEQVKRQLSLQIALAPSQRGTEGEETALREALDAAKWGKVGRAGMFEQKGLEQRAWVRLGELCVMKGELFLL